MEREQDTIAVRDLSKSFSGVHVLRDIEFLLRPGEIHALVGENGAGKSTFIKILSGAYQRDSGVVEVGGRAVSVLNPQIAQELGIVTIYQERNLVPELTVAENILIANEPTDRWGNIRWKQLYRQGKEIIGRLNLRLNERDFVWQIGAAEQQLVEIAKALYKRARVVIMDEPTASLTQVEIQHLFELIRELKKQRVSVIYVSHRLDEVFEIANCVTVLRDGRKVGDYAIDSISKAQLIKAMIGTEIRFTHIGERGDSQTCLRAERLTLPESFEQVSFSLQEGEIVGLAGMVGSGKSELARVAAGVERPEAGRIYLFSKDMTGCRLQQYIRNGVGYVPAERDSLGLVQSMDIAGNITLASLPKTCFGPFLRIGYEKKLAKDYIRNLGIASRGVGQEVQYLSGGNRQKVMLAKWLCLGIRVLVMDEPTQGVDVGAREEIHQKMRDLIREGKSILMVTSDFDELLNMTHRILVMSRGRLVADLNTRETTQEEVLKHAIGR